MSNPRTSNLPLSLLSIALGAATLVAIALSKFMSGPFILIIVSATLVAFLAALVMLARRPPRSAGRMIGRLALSMLGALVAGYAVLLLVISFGQDVIANRTNAFFQPKRLTEVAAARIEAPGVEKLEIGTPDGALLRGWLVHNSENSKAPLALYFGGSGSESSEVLQKARLLAPWSVALVNYRGFGESTGTPTPDSALSDALWLYDVLSQRPDVDRSRIVPVGYSMGTGMAVHVAEQRPAAGAVLFAPYASLELVKPGESAIWAPLQGLMKDYFNSIEKASNAHAPLFVLVGSQDKVFPPDVARSVAARWGGPSRVKVYEGEGHTLSETNKGSWLDVKTFLDTLQAAK